MAVVERHCKNCEHGIFCNSWGEYKCVVLIRRIYKPDEEALGCVYYKKKSRKVLQDDPKCRCEHCQSREKDE